MHPSQPSTPSGAAAGAILRPGAPRCRASIWRRAAGPARGQQELGGGGRAGALRVAKNQSHRRGNDCWGRKASASFHKEKVKILSNVFQILLKSVWICNSLQKPLSMTVNTTAYSLYPWRSPEKNIKNTYWFSGRCLNLSKRNHSFHSHPIPCFLLHPLHLAQDFH